MRYTTLLGLSQGTASTPCNLIGHSTSLIIGRLQEVNNTIRNIARMLCPPRAHPRSLPLGAAALTTGKKNKQIAQKKYILSLNISLFFIVTVDMEIEKFDNLNQLIFFSDQKL